MSSYSSSNASWPDCSKTRTPCCSPSCDNCLPGACSDGGCCEECPKRLCAKIFLGFIPALFHVLKFLREKCEKGKDWNDFNINKVTPLGKFLLGMGFNLTQLDESKDGQKLSGLLSSLFTSGSLIPLYNASKNYFTSKFKTYHYTSDSPSGSPPKSSPSTVRDMLFWLYGLRFTSGFPSLVLHCSALCLPFGNSFNSDAFCYYIYTCCFLLPVSFISVIQCPDGSPSFLPSHSDWQNFCYPSDTLELFEKFCEYVRKLYIPLTFLYFQCKNDSGQGGWKDCWYGKNCIVSSTAVFLGSSDFCNCSSSGSTGQGYLCNKDHSGKCSAASSSGSSCNSKCPHPLQRFLCDDNSLFKTPDSFGQLDFGQNPPVMLDSFGHFKMGFTQQNLSSTAKSGSSIHPVLGAFCNFGFYPLTRLCEFVLCVTLEPPSSLLDLFAFFKRIGETLKIDTFKSGLVEWINGEPGSYDGDSLNNAVQRLYNFKASHSASSHTASDLYSLCDCSGAKGLSTPDPTCGPYMYPLIADAFQLYPTTFNGMYLSWVCYLAKEFKKGLEKFKGDLQNCPHCIDPSAKCDKIVKCPCVFPKLYKYGFIFWRGWNLNCTDAYGNSKHEEDNTKGDHKKGDPGCTQKSCSDFLDQLDKVVRPGSSLDLLIKAINVFL
ncbi:variant erythrocyte surface antigen-1 family protein, partial [Babesia divergens]